MSKYYNVVSCKTVTNPETDDKKKIYHKVGVLKATVKGSLYLQMYHQPNVSYQIFPNGDDELPTINFDGNDA
jgi:hypothetical protein